MEPKDFEDDCLQYEQVLEILETLPDEKVSTAKIEKELQDPDVGLAYIIQQLVYLGEVELCQERGTGHRVWLKRRGDQYEGSISLRSIWQGYVFEDNGRKIADRLFSNRDAAIEHLAEAVGVDPASYEPLSFLDDVWVAQVGTKGWDEKTAVVRRTMIYE